MSSLYCNVCKQDHHTSLAKWCDRSDLEIENEKLSSQLKEALAIIEELRTSNEFYAEIDSWRRTDNDHEPMRYMIIDEEDRGQGVFRNQTVNDENVGGKLAREIKQSTDERIEKLKKEL